MILQMVWDNEHDCDYNTFDLFWCWRQDILALGVKAMPADSLASKVARASRDMVLTVLERPHVLLF